MVFLDFPQKDQCPFLSGLEYGRTRSLSKHEQIGPTNEMETAKNEGDIQIPVDIHVHHEPRRSLK